LPLREATKHRIVDRSAGELGQSSLEEAPVWLGVIVVF
jgi:hypothetical protein